MILIDPTEASSTSRLSESVINAAVVCPGLEAVTGADILLSAISTPKIESLSNYNKPTQICLRKHLDAGMLIQRKTTDLAASVPNLKESLAKMLAFEPKYGCWLLFAGDFYVDKDGEPIINGQPVYGGMRAETLLITDDKWQLRGGFYKHLKSDGMLPMWIREVMGLIQKINAEPTVSIDIHKPVQTILSGSVDRPWRSMIMGIPGFGVAKMQSLMAYCDEHGLGNRLIDVISYITNTANYKADDHPARIGFGDFQAAARWYGVNPGEEITVNDEFSQRLWREYQENTPQFVKPEPLVDSDGQEITVPWS